MARRFAKVLEEEIEEGFFYPSDLVNNKTTIPLNVTTESATRNTNFLFGTETIQTLTARNYQNISGH